MGMESKTPDAGILKMLEIAEVEMRDLKTEVTLNMNNPETLPIDAFCCVEETVAMMAVFRDQVLTDG